MRYFDNILTEIATWCDHDPTPEPVAVINYGALYNWYAASDIRNIANTGWHVPDHTEHTALMTYLDPDGTNAVNDAGGKLKEIGTTHWQSPNTDATNETGFSAEGTGRREVDGSMVYINQYTFYWASDLYVLLDRGYIAGLFYNQNRFSVTIGIVSTSYFKGTGNPIRLVKDSTTLTNGQIGSYTGNDGKIYRTICIGTQEWLADNLVETKYRDDTDIPIVTDNAAWGALVTGAMCYYNNDITNAIY